MELYEKIEELANICGDANTGKSFKEALDCLWPDDDGGEMSEDDEVETTTYMKISHPTHEHRIDTGRQ